MVLLRKLIYKIYFFILTIRYEYLFFATPQMKTWFKFSLVLVLVFNFCLLPLFLYSINPSLISCISCPGCSTIRNPNFEVPIDEEDRKDWQSQRLAVLITHKDRFRELIEIVPYISKFLTLQKLPFSIWVLNQVDTHRFNKGVLYNLGFSLSSNSSEYVTLQDIDLLPINPNISYRYHEAGPLHLTSPELHPLYHYEKFFGGIVLMTNHHYNKVNGFSNIFWGWGREDDEFYLRVKEAGLQVYRPEGITTGYDTFFHNHFQDRKRDSKLYYNQRVVSFHRDRTSGLDTVSSSVESYTVHEVTFDGYPCKVVNVKINCDYEFTPFCDTPS